MKSLPSMASILVLLVSSVFFSVGCMASAATSADVDEQGSTEETAQAVGEATEDEENTGEIKDAICGLNGGYNGLIGVGFGFAPFATCGCVVGVGLAGAGVGVGAGQGNYGQTGYGAGYGAGLGYGAGYGGCP